MSEKYLIQAGFPRECNIPTSVKNHRVIMALKGRFYVNNRNIFSTEFLDTAFSVNEIGDMNFCRTALRASTVTGLIDFHHQPPERLVVIMERKPIMLVMILLKQLLPLHRLNIGMYSQ